MPFQVRVEQRPAAEGVDGTVYVLDGGRAGRAEVAPAIGFNCYHWEVPAPGGEAYNLLFADPEFFNHGKPTRTGIPILFPFPNRIRNGEYIWEGKTYHLPRNDPSGRNAIHGFACRRAWNVVKQEADDTRAAVAAEFRSAVEGAEARELWPAEYVLRVKYSLTERRLAVLAEVENPGPVPLPFGLGYHPYFRVAATPFEESASCRVQVPARDYWVLQDSLPSGERKPVEGGRDLLQPRPYPELKLDDVLTGLPGGDGLCPRGSVYWKTGPAELRVLASADFRDVVVFTPPHRQAICIEPYTCVTDAINLQARGSDAGWRVLGPGEHWRGAVEFQLHVGTAS